MSSLTTTYQSMEIPGLSKYIVNAINDPVVGHRVKFKFPNGFGASLIKQPLDREGRFEIAVLNKDGYICYDSGITEDVESYLSKEEVISILNAIKNLEATNEED